MIAYGPCVLLVVVVAAWLWSDGRALVPRLVPVLFAFFMAGVTVDESQFGGSVAWAVGSVAVAVGQLWLFLVWWRRGGSWAAVVSRSKRGRN